MKVSGRGDQSVWRIVPDSSTNKIKNMHSFDENIFISGESDTEINNNNSNNNKFELDNLNNKENRSGSKKRKLKEYYDEQQHQNNEIVSKRNSKNRI